MKHLLVDKIIIGLHEGDRRDHGASLAEPDDLFSLNWLDADGEVSSRRAGVLRDAHVYQALLGAGEPDSGICRHEQGGRPRTEATSSQLRVHNENPWF